MGISMTANGGKEARQKIRIGTAGGKYARYSTLSIIWQSAEDQIDGQMGRHEINSQYKLREPYASRMPPPTSAYLRVSEFRMESQHIELINPQMNETLPQCIYLGAKGSSEGPNEYFTCQVKLCPCRQMARYARGSVDKEEANWGASRVRLFLNAVALQRDVLKGR